MKRKTGDQPNSRRAFLKGVMATGGGAAIAAVSSAPVLAQTQQDHAEAPQSVGYQLSEHVLEYYKTLKS